MDLRRLRYFVAVAGGPAPRSDPKRLHMSQPPLSMQIKALERELGVGLLERTSRRVAVTDAGRAFLERARTNLGAVEEAPEVADP